MGLETAIIGTGILGAVSSNRAAKKQTQAADGATQAQEAAMQQMRDDLQPWRDLGQSKIAPLNNLLTGQGQLDYINNNPFFKSMMNQSKNALFANQAARGKLGSGATDSALQDQFMGAGNALVSDQYNRLYNLVGMGNNAAAQQGSAAMNTAQNTGQLMLQKGNVQAQNAMNFGNLVGGGVLGGVLGNQGALGEDVNGWTGAAMGMMR